jgi:hypothetical protein
MRKQGSFILIILLVFFLSRTSLATVYTSNGTGVGVWDVSTAWSSTEGTPVCGDTIFIQAGDIITIGIEQDYSASSSPMFIAVDGTLEFPVNGPKLMLPSGSGVTINTGGLLTATAGGSAIFLEICGIIDWKKADGDVNGLFTFGVPFSLSNAPNSLELVYKFTVNGISTPELAKQVQYEIQQSLVNSSCVFIDECDCFKLATTDLITYNTLKNILSANGYQLLGEIYVSDGRVLKPIIGHQTEKE